MREEPITEVTLRKYEHPTDNFKANIRRFLLCLGLVRPGDKESAAEAILQALLTYGRPVSVRRLAQVAGISESGVRYHLAQLKALNLVEKDGRSSYKIAEEDLSLAFKLFRRYALEDVLDRIAEYAAKLSQKKGPPPSPD